MSRVCEKHQQYCPDDICRWCPAPEPLGLLASLPHASVFTGIMPTLLGVPVVIDPNMGPNDPPVLMPARPDYVAHGRPDPGCYRRFCVAPTVGFLTHTYAPGGKVHFCEEHRLSGSPGLRSLLNP